MRKKRFIYSCVLMIFILTMTFTSVQANQAQLRIFNAGLFLGQAEAQMRLIGTPANAAVIDILIQARDSMIAAEPLFTQPFRQIRDQNQSLQRAVSAINNYIRNSELFDRQNVLAAARVGKIQYMHAVYKAGFNCTYNSGRLDDLMFTANCDRYILRTGFKLGEAWVASQIRTNRARYRQSGWLSDMYHAIGYGIKVSVDRGNRMIRLHGVDDYKVICCFGRKSEWDRVPRLGKNSTLEQFQEALPIMRNVVANAGVPDCKCPSKSASIPDVCGMTLIDAKKKLEKVGLVIKPSLLGPAPNKAKALRVDSQEPAAGKKINPGSEVKVYVFGKFATPPPPPPPKKYTPKM
ncbi:MAG: PASTA domain-containing protein [Candidatus Aminicenantes bacterium]|nr:PASTA domain-containing protein [Candidatus Aminicenantes bacterium]